MATINFYVKAKVTELAPIYVRLLAGRKVDLTANSDLFVNPDRWSNKTQTIKQRITTEDDDKLIIQLKGLKSHIETEFKKRIENHSKEWLIEVIDKFHNKKDAKAKNLNEYIDKYIQETKAGTRKNKSSVNLAPGTIRIYEGFKRIFGIYQGIYSEKDIKAIEDKNKILEKANKSLIQIRPLKKLDFENINIDFYNSFVNFLTDEGYSLNTMGRFIKTLKLIMKKALEVDKLHTNQEFKYEAFKGMSEKSNSIYLTKEELDKIYRKDLSKFPRMDLARDAFIILCETCLRISDYSKIEVNIRTIEGKRFIDILQTKTGTKVIIPLTKRFDEIWKKYNNNLPRIPEQYVNKFIKTIGSWCEIDEVIRWEGVKFGKKHQKSAKKYELLTCHTGRRTACTNMYKAGIPLKDIREISGHSSDKQLLDYIRISQEETALRLSDHPYYSGLKVVS